MQQTQRLGRQVGREGGAVSPFSTPAATFALHSVAAVLSCAAVSSPCKNMNLEAGSGVDLIRVTTLDERCHESAKRNFVENRFYFFSSVEV
jgi:hypothetical protein